LCCEQATALRRSRSAHAADGHGHGPCPHADHVSAHAYAPLGRGIGIGLITALPAAVVVGLGAVVPATRGFFQDERATGGGTRQVLFETLVRIPLGTALPEEVIFRGSLLGLFTQRHSPAVAASMSSILFGAWHVLPTLRTLPLNPVGARVRGNPKHTAGAVLAAVTATTLAGYGLAWLRFGSGSIVAPVVAHASLNGAAYLAARFVVHPASDTLATPGRPSHGCRPGERAFWGAAAPQMDRQGCPVRAGIPEGPGAARGGVASRRAGRSR
jgi:membrane protease YdiL (CAAX protease family)